MRSAEIPHVPEIINPHAEMVGLQGRLLLADQKFLNPTQSLAEGDLQFTSFEDRDYSVFDATVTRDTKKFWNEFAPGKDLEARKITWAVDMSFRVNEASSKNVGEFFKHIGMDIDPTDIHFTTGHAKELYDRYFSKPPEGKGVKKFVGDMLSWAEFDGKVDLKFIERNLADISWLATMFPEKDAEMITQLVLGEAKLKIAEAALKAQVTTTSTTPSGEHVMRINKLNKKERRMLNRLERPDMLPAFSETDELQHQALHNPNVIMLGGTGSGKTTGTPVMLYDILEPGEKMIVTEPLRINAADLAGTVARLVGGTLGKEVGYQHGDMDRPQYDQEETEILFMTESILALLLSGKKRNPFLDKVRYVMVDEIHVQNADTEIVLGLLKEEQERRKNADPPLPPLTVLGVSATADKEKLQTYFDNDSPIEIEGRMFPVEVNYSPQPIKNKEVPKTAEERKKQSEALPKAAAEKTNELLHDPQTQDGDIVIAVPGQADMKKIHKFIEENALPQGTKIIELHRDSPEELKQEISREAPSGERRIIIATNVIETGITMPSARYLINLGEKFESFVDQDSGLTYVRKTLQSQAECAQWVGRLGRVAPGTVFHLFTKDNPDDPDNFEARRKYPLAEMERIDLTDYVLLFKTAGRDIRTLDLLSKVTDEQKAIFEKRVAFAEETLQKLGAMNPDGTITDIGREMQRMKKEYRLEDFHVARMLVEAKRAGKGFLDVFTIAALMGERSLFTNREAKRNFFTNSSDFLTYLSLWSQYETIGRREDWATEHGLNHSALQRIHEKRKKLLEKVTEDPPASQEEIAKYVFIGYKDRLMRYEGHTYVWERNNLVSFNIYLDRDSAANTPVENPKYIVAASNKEILEGQRKRQVNGQSQVQKYNFVRVSNCQSIPKEWVEE